MCFIYTLHVSVFSSLSRSLSLKANVYQGEHNICSFKYCKLALMLAFIQLIHYLTFGNMYYKWFPCWLVQNKSNNMMTWKQMSFYDIIGSLHQLHAYLLYALWTLTPLWAHLCICFAFNINSTFKLRLCAFTVLYMTVYEKAGQHLMSYFSLQERSGDDPVWS